MSISLYKHNAEAYEAALDMLVETGKAAIIHPTGTGKSFIGFKLCAEHLEAKVCWLSPSEYIYETQLENLKAASDGFQPQNISFYTYAKLMLMSDAEIKSIAPDFIILDEFHRCGAQMWGQSVQKLLNANPKVPILGLSATNIRYLDNQRDMADELFEGNIASEITLGESIVRGIINPPKYVLAMFRYRDSLEKYEVRIRKTKSKAVRDAAKQYLEELRRTLDKADGLDVIFDKHMTERTGKYIVFCANKEHMDEMMTHTEWFAKVDSSPRLYSVYTPDAATAKEFAAFKADDDTSHLRLLFCIDALNEGIHVDDVSGVILLRPTISPIIYKQQIGRALSASKKNDVVIFDIVLNIENLYNIGAIEDEMEVATAWYRVHGEGRDIINEHFEVIDEVRDCRELFEKLNDTLIASWDIYYAHAKAYYEENGDLQVPAKYVTPDGYVLGHWISNQRGIRRGKHKGKLTQTQINKLDDIGMVWDYASDVSWNRKFKAAKTYYERNGHLKPPLDYMTDDGIALGYWVYNLRRWRNEGRITCFLTEERIRQLDSIGMSWERMRPIPKDGFEAAVAYYQEHGDLDVPRKYVSEDGVHLGDWICRQRRVRRGKLPAVPLSEERIAALDRMGMIWDTHERAWEKGFSEAWAYYQTYGDLRVSDGYVSASGFKLGNWMWMQRNAYQTGKLSEAKQERLSALGMRWDTRKKLSWEQRLALVKEYCAKNEVSYIPHDAVVDGFWIGHWIASQRALMRKGELSADRVEMLRSLSIEPLTQQEIIWSEMCANAAEYAELHGNLKVPVDYCCENGTNLYNWLLFQRSAYKKGKLTAEQIRRLEEIGFQWKIESRWERGYRYAKAYFEENGHLRMKRTYINPDGYWLGEWVAQCRKAHNGEKSEIAMTSERTAMLEAIGMVWEKPAGSRSKLMTRA